MAYLGDTVADVQTVVRARAQVPEQRFVSLAVVPPHLQTPQQVAARGKYEHQLMKAGADVILSTTQEALGWVDQLD